jgi:hypothetical protein
MSKIPRTSIQLQQMIMDEINRMGGCPPNLKMWVEPYQRGEQKQTSRRQRTLTIAFLAFMQSPIGFGTNMICLIERGSGATLAESGYAMAKKSNSNLLEVIVARHELRGNGRSSLMAGF